MEIEFVVGIVLGFLSYCITAPKGDYSKSLRIKGVHIHHWIYLIPVMYIMRTNILLVGFCVGGIIQGITMYSDWYKIIDRDNFVI
jgi:hypothetical protein